MPKGSPFLWFDSQAEEAANFYVSLFPNSRVSSVRPDVGSAQHVVFELDGVEFMAFNAGPHFTFNEAVSFFVKCETQDEVDRYWNALTANGGEESRCGWLKDRWGLSWQIVPNALGEYLGDPDPEKAQRVMQAMLQMNKIEVAALDRAYAAP